MTIPFKSRVKGCLGGKCFGSLLGKCGDDWQLTRAVTRSLICKGEFDVNDILHEHIVELEKSDVGWEQTTHEAILALKFTRSLTEYESRNSFVSMPYDPGRGAENGVAKKIAPLALASICTMGSGVDVLSDQILQLGLATHGDPRASIAAFAMGMCVVVACEWREDNKIVPTEIEGSILYQIQCMEEKFGVPRPWVSERLRLLLDPKTWDSVESLARAVGTSCLAWESIPFSIGVAIRHASDSTMEAAMLEAMKAGGDAGTNASMVGMLLGARHGADAIPIAWQAAFPDAMVEVDTLTDQFVARFEAGAMGAHTRTTSHQFRSL